jgi:ubiquitin carboxyl-terminal hydrolase 7
VSNLSNGFAKLYLEIAEADKPLPVLKNDQMLLFVKYFDVKQQNLRYNDRVNYI